MHALVQITRHDCVEGWSAIRAWSGVSLGSFLNRRAADGARTLRDLPGRSRSVRAPSAARRLRKLPRGTPLQAPTGAPAFDAIVAGNLRQGMHGAQFRERERAFAFPTSPSTMRRYAARLPAAKCSGTVRCSAYRNRWCGSRGPRRTACTVSPCRASRSARELSGSAPSSIRWNGCRL